MANTPSIIEEYIPECDIPAKTLRKIEDIPQILEQSISIIHREIIRIKNKPADKRNASDIKLVLVCMERLQNIYKVYSDDKKAMQKLIEEANPNALQNIVEQAKQSIKQSTKQQSAQ